MQNAEVVIVGAGPAGSAAALLLARRGRVVLLVDQARFPRDKPCGEYLNPAAAAILRRIGLEPVLRSTGGRAVTGVYLSSPAGRAVRVLYPVGSAQGSPVPPPHGLSVPRLALDAALRGAAEGAGARVREGFRVEDLLRAESRVVGLVGRSERGAEEIRARLVIAADGSRSMVARRLGLMRKPPARRIGLVAHYEEVEGDDWVEMHAGRRGYCGLGYSAEGGANVAMVAGPEDLPSLQGRVEAFYEERLAQFPAVARRLARGRRTGKVLVTGSMSSRTAAVGAPGVLLVGDAAGFYDPFTGEGLSYALRGAELAAQAADRMLNHENTKAGDEAAAIRAYAAQRRREFAPRVLVSRALQAVLRRPWMLEAVFRRFEADPALAQHLIGVTAGILPPRLVLNPSYLVQLLAPAAPTFRRSIPAREVLIGGQHD